ncbi:lactose transport system permease protein; LacF [Bacillus sp. NRRL B-14911]|uniref:Lactose ABC transporter permease n=1 Tax=Bacillus infantis NRRL B-14911 TaxID=1367477 RepID=U5LF05_9BACI|nr:MULTISPECIES: sugar ABC transporter permease [Bacillus]AGX06444.1 lactose ABC transporter permease [Bacillus infantis NRRL B-14911]EAR68628.1 lactose transport system permease protein; LacF [Bacillus sp. NRRL B-14911]
MNREPAVLQNLEIKSVPKKRKKFKLPLTPWLFLLPSIVILGTFLAYPIIEAFKWSFLDYKIIAGTGEFVGLANFKEIYTDSDFWNAFVNTLVFLVIVLPLNVFLPMILAVLVNQKIRAAGVFRVLYYLPVITPMVVAALMWKMLYSQNGVIAELLAKIGLFDSPTNLLVQSSTALTAVAAITIWKGLGYYMIIYLAGLQSIPKDVYESASIDGASVWQQFTRITVPMLTPSITLVSVMTIIAGMKVFEEIALTTGGGPAGATTTLVMYIYAKFNSLDVSIASAAGLVLLVMAIGASLLQMKLTSKREDDLRA